jgi:hypothetical protein
MGALDMVDDSATNAAASIARSALVTTMVLGGLALILFLRASTATRFADGNPGGKVRLTGLVLAMFALYLVVHVLPFTRTFFDVVLLDATEYALIGVAVLAWAVLIWWTWRARLLERFLGVRLG